MVCMLLVRCTQSLSVSDSIACHYLQVTFGQYDAANFVLIPGAKYINQVLMLG